MNKIIPAVLALTSQDALGILDTLAESGIDFPRVQIDVTDGDLVDSTTFTDREALGNTTWPWPLELHLMVTHPQTELTKWLQVLPIESVIVHAESEDPAGAIAYAKGRGLEVGIALNPESPLEIIAPYINNVDRVLFLTVSPGKQGNPFLPEVCEKMKDFSLRYSSAVMAADGGLNPKTIPLVRDAGVTEFNVGINMDRAQNINEFYQELINC